MSELKESDLQVFLARIFCQKNETNTYNVLYNEEELAYSQSRFGQSIRACAFNSCRQMTNRRQRNGDSRYGRVKFVRSLKFTSLGHRISDWHIPVSAACACIANDFLNDCATAAGCDRRSLALSLPLRRLTGFYVACISHFFLFAKTKKPADSNPICCTLFGSRFTSNRTINDRMAVMAGCH